MEGLTHCCHGIPLFSLPMIMKYRTMFLRHQKILLLGAKVRICTTSGGTENQTTSTSKAPKKSNFCQASVTPKRSGAVSWIHTSNKHAAKRKFQSCASIPRVSDVSVGRKTHFNGLDNLRDSFSFWRKERNRQQQSLNRALCSWLPAVSPLVLDIGSLPWCRSFQILYQLAVTRLKRP